MRKIDIYFLLVALYGSISIAYGETCSTHPWSASDPNANFTFNYQDDELGGEYYSPVKGEELSRAVRMLENSKIVELSDVEVKKLAVYIVKQNDKIKFFLVRALKQHPNAIIKILMHNNHLLIDSLSVGEPHEAQETPIIIQLPKRPDSVSIGCASMR